MLLGFGLVCVAGMLCTGIAGWYMTDRMDDAWKISGMLTGLYTGGTPNVNAIGIALDAPASYMVLIQAADVLLGGAYLLGLISFLPAVYSKLYPYQEPKKDIAPDQSAAFNEVQKNTFKPQIKLFLLGLGVTSLSLGLCYLITGGIDNGTLIILLLTSFGLVLGSIKKVQEIGDSYPLGEYFILIFCVALGLLADFRQLATEGMELLLFSAIALTATTLLHLLLCYWFKIDRDTVILSSVAGFYGPVFVVQVATAINNKSLMAAGLGVSLLGFGLGNYLGIGVAYVLRWFGG